MKPGAPLAGSPEGGVRDRDARRLHAWPSRGRQLGGGVLAPTRLAWEAHASLRLHFTDRGESRGPRMSSRGRHPSWHLLKIIHHKRSADNAAGARLALQAARKFYEVIHFAVVRVRHCLTSGEDTASAVRHLALHPSDDA